MRLNFRFISIAAVQDRSRRMCTLGHGFSLLARQEYANDVRRGSTLACGKRSVFEDATVDPLYFLPHVTFSVATRSLTAANANLFAVTTQFIYSAVCRVVVNSNKTIVWIQA